MERYELICEATVGGEILQARMTVSVELYSDPDARKLAERQLRMGLMAKIVDRNPPEISARRVSPPLHWAV